jgi:uncharacterized membrane protein
MIFLYILFFIFLCLKKYYNFGYNVYDLAIFNQTFFNTLHGQWFQETVNINNYLADHFSPIIIFLLPIYYFWQAPEMLLILQSVIIGLSAWPLYLIAQVVLKDKSYSLLVALFWFFNPFVQTANLYEFHLLSLAVFFVLWVFYFYQQNNFKLFLLFFVLSLLVREDISLILLGFFPLTILDRKLLIWKITSIFLPLIYFFISLKVIGHFSSGGYKFFAYYGWLGGHDFFSIIWSWLTHPWPLLLHILYLGNFFSLVVILMPFLFLPLLKPKYLWLSLLPFLQIALTMQRFNFVAYSLYYNMAFMPGLFLTLIFALKKISQQENFWLSKLVKHNRLFFCLVLGLTFFYFTIFLSPAPRVLGKSYLRTDVDNKKAFLALIPQEATLASEATFLAPLSSRETIYALSYAYIGKAQFSFQNFVLPQVDFILVDFSSFLSNLVEIEDSPSLTKIRRQSLVNWHKILANYSLIKAHNNLFLWQATSQTTEEGLVLYEPTIIKKNFVKENFLVDSKVSSKEGEMVLKLTFQARPGSGSNYLVRFQGPDYFFDVPFDYGLWPMSDWPDNKLASFYYYLDKEITGYQVFSWQGINTLGYTKELFSKLELVPQTELVIF